MKFKGLNADRDIGYMIMLLKALIKCMYFFIFKAKYHHNNSVHIFLYDTLKYKVTWKLGCQLLHVVTGYSMESFPQLYSEMKDINDDQIMHEFNMLSLINIVLMQLLSHTEKTPCEIITETG